MNIVPAQLKKDILCQRFPLIAWGSCLGLALLAIGLLTAFSHSHPPNPDNPNSMMKLVAFIGLFTGCMLAAGFGLFLLTPILVIRIVHEDPLMGTTAFWRTRPVPREQLLAAKALLIALLLLPLVLFKGANIQFGSSTFWVSEIAWIAAVAAISSITSGAQEFIGYGVAILFGKVVFGSLIERLWEYFHGPGASFSNEAISSVSAASAASHFNSADLFHLCYFAGFAAVFVHQYLTLERKRSLALLIITIVVLSILQAVFGPAQP